MWAFPHCPQFCLLELLVWLQFQCLRGRGSVGFPTLSTVLSARAPGLVSVPVSEREGSVCGYSYTAHSFVLNVPLPGENSVRSKGGDVGFPHFSTKCANCLNVTSAEVATFQFFEKSRIHHISGGVSDEQHGFEP